MTLLFNGEFSHSSAATAEQDVIRLLDRVSYRILGYSNITAIDVTLKEMQ